MDRIKTKKRGAMEALFSDSESGSSCEDIEKGEPEEMKRQATERAKVQGSS